MFPAATSTLTWLRTVGPIPYRNVMSRHSTIAADGAEAARSVRAEGGPGNNRTSEAHSTAHSVSPADEASSGADGPTAPGKAGSRRAHARFATPTAPSGTTVTTNIDKTPYSTCWSHGLM